MDEWKKEKEEDREEMEKEGGQEKQRIRRGKHEGERG